MFCKTIILSNSDNLVTNAPKGILTLSKEQTSITGKIRLYNMPTLPQGAKVGMYINEKVHIVKILKKNNYYQFELDNSIDITQSIYCAILDMNDNKKVILEGGSFNGFCFTDSPFDAILEEKDEELEHTISEAIKLSNSCEQCSCADCEYKKYFYDHYSQNNKSNYLDNKTPSNDSNIEYEQVGIEDIQTLNNLENKSSPVDIINPVQSKIDSWQEDVIHNLENEFMESVECLISPTNQNKTLKTKESCLNNTEISHISNNIEQLKNKDTNEQDDNNLNTTNTDNDKLEFLNSIVEQLDILFDQNPPDEILNSIFPDSKFIQVQGESPYVVGAIYEEDMLKYIAYGVPANYNTLPPTDLGEHYQWLPLNPNDVMSDGYFMIYQDAITGNLVEINLE